MPLRPAQPAERRVGRTLAAPSTVAAVAALAAAACSDDPVIPIDPCLEAAQVTLGQAVNGVLGSGDCVQLSGILADRYTLTLTAETSVRIDLASTQFDAFLELRTQIGDIIASNDDTGGLDSRLIETLPAGTYVILVRSFGVGEAGNYLLTVSTGPDCTPLGTLELGESVNGTLAPTDCLFQFGGFADNWTLSLTGQETIRLSLDSDQFQEGVVVQSAEGSILGLQAALNPGEPAQLDIQLNAGTYTVVATSVLEGRTGNYTLLVDVAPECIAEATLAFGETVGGKLESDDCLGDFGALTDVWDLSLSEQTTVDILMKSTDFEPFILLRDAFGVDVAVGFDDQRIGRAAIATTLTAGAYEVHTATLDPSARGDYTLTATQIECADVQPIALGESVDGTLSAFDCPRAGGAFQESWSLTLAADTTVQIDLVSADFDGFLMLLDSAGTVVETNDDGGVGLNSRIDTLLTAGTYEIVVSTFAAGETGDYTLTVSVPAAGAAGARSPVAVVKPRAPKGVEAAWRERAALYRSQDPWRMVAPGVPAPRLKPRW